MAAAALLVAYGQGNHGDDGMDQTDTEASATPTFRALPRQPSESVHVSPKVTKTFLPSKSPKLLAATQDAEITLPKWEMKPVKDLTSPTPVPQAKSEPDKKVATATPSNQKKSSPTTTRKAAGSGQGGGRGNAARGAPPPQIISSFAPSYPSAARRSGVEGTATVKVSVNTSGRVADCSIFRSAGNEALDEAALKAVKRWRFTPAQNDGTEVLVQVKFRLG